MTKYDAIFIGAGHNALACAAHLAKRGWKVGLFEAADRPGGAVKTLELTEPGFRHDVAAMNLSLFAGSAFNRVYGAELAQHGLEFAPVQDCFASVFPGGQWLGVSTDLATTTARIRAFSARDGETWETLVKAFPVRAERIFSILGSSMKKRALARILFSLLRKDGISGTLDLGRFLLSSPRAWLDETFESNEVKALLGAWGMHLDFAPDIAGGAVFPYLEGMANQSFGMVLGKGGADTIIMALTAMVESHGGTIECNARVERVVTAGGRATGVVLAGGRRIEASRAVIATVSPKALDGLLPEGSGNDGFDQKMQNFRHAPGTMMIHLAVDSLPDWADPALQRFAYVHVAPSLDVMARAYQEAQAGLLPTEPVIVVGQPTAIDPIRAPDGKHILWLQTRVVPAEIKGDAAGIIQDRDWATVREAYADRAIAIIERYAPGLAAKIIKRTVMSPLDLESGNANLVGGDQICGSHHLSQNFLFRPAPGSADWSTPVRNFHLAGAATWPGAGVGAGSGFLLAQQLAGG
ncbi:MAG TPA: NAD(P)/FAD-dependent oxidoreductase [Mesorhizobium sp.]|jgi:phytoene dehydrogenase-like protein|uniref:phytoene desaturase family protein n=1 Tax=Mesorhizobium sp. TaxID=1871066 RepID=UPI002DDDBC17|nr:NAD(P)/FAD-dependent oxidoreductase [Mesorhizobium sp.]HEV2507262.1 NAD(P)/FAD-dependent oxidoreductase [Mesorhizobium sp.]